MPELLVSKQKGFSFRVPLPCGNFNIGRSSDNDLTLPDYDISRQHAKIQYQMGQFYLKDLSPSSELLDNEGFKLEDGQKIKLGSWTLVFHERAIEDENYKEEIKTCLSKIQQVSPTKILKIDPKREVFLTESVSLILCDKNGKTKEIPLRHDRILIGSDMSCNIVLDDDYVSGEHCELLRIKQGYILRDLGSTNGTYLRDSLIKQSYLRLEEEVLLGETSFYLKGSQEEEKIDCAHSDHFCGMVGKSEALRRLFTKIERVAPTDHTVLISGETGSGKELIARALHELSERREQPYVIVNCGAISSTLIESELFGHEKGSFTGAHHRRLGAFEQAQGGTLFLDELGELPLDLQPKLLRVLENRTIKRVGSAAEINVDLRIVAATHRNLSDLVKQGKFREDLFYRLSIVPLHLPSLRDRKEDIPILIEHFIRQATGSLTKTFSEEAIKKMQSYRWPGNVRELKNIVMRSLIFSESKKVMPGDLDLPQEKDTNQISHILSLSDVEKLKIEEVLKQTEGNKTKAASVLGIAKSTLFKKIKEHKLSA